ncbi:hypothetical protein XELAEV_18019804mg [Xenopus laevis]|uniref:Uncharacterized protein n=1 Tax=Xenopus laevis TaxID=8355 RepID=A0A974D7J8_XENLA|nr:hypothetical protein XELAEV_18019804mg [Xenopus laevis]
MSLRAFHPFTDDSYSSFVQSGHTLVGINERLFQRNVTFLCMIVANTMSRLLLATEGTGYSQEGGGF